MSRLIKHTPTHGAALRTANRRAARHTADIVHKQAGAADTFSTPAAGPPHPQNSMHSHLHTAARVLHVRIAPGKHVQQQAAAQPTAHRALHGEHAALRRQVERINLANQPVSPLQRGNTVPAIVCGRTPPNTPPGAAPHRVCSINQSTGAQG